MDILNTKIDNVLTEKTLKVRPENIKNGVSIFGINGNYTGNLTDAEYEEANDDLDDILEGTTPMTIYPPDWSGIGYTETPQSILDEFNYSKNIKDNWDITQTSLVGKFTNDTTLKYMPLVDTSNVTNMQNCFFSCTNLEVIPLLNTSNVTSMTGFCQGCSNLKSIALIDTGNVTSFQSVFSGASKLETVPRFDTKNATSVFVMFQGCTKLKDVPVFDLSKATTVFSMFQNCSALSNDSLNNIMEMCIGATHFNGTKTLAHLGISSAQATICQGLSNYQAFLAAGWTTGY